MSTPLQSLIASGTKLWLDSIDPKEVDRNRAWGASGATSNPIIIADLIKTGRFDNDMAKLMRDGLGDDDLAWAMTDQLVRQAQKVFMPVWEATRGDDGYVSFELDALIEDPARNLPVKERTRLYIELGKKWAAGHKNRMIKIPNTEGGVAALEELAAAGVTLNVTLTFSPKQYFAARDAVWSGARRRKSLDQFKSVYSIFVSRLDVYTEKHVSQLPPRSQGMVGIVNAKRIWKMNQDFWADKKLPLKQEIIFASTGTKKPSDPPWKYVEAFAGSDIETNPPATNELVQASGRTLTRQVDKLPSKEILSDIDTMVDIDHMEQVLMEEGIKKFADPQKALLALIAEKRKSLKTAAGK
ncbi:MAG TPA: transaldolase family protein [Gemmataceae bacterium]|nr:transaldolase family protein [Gemmataceae bacterium]